jgi:hypothetical protein
MKRYSLTLPFILLSLCAKSQYDFGMKMPGFQATDIFDTVHAIILIDNKKLEKVERIKGYAVRMWKTWYGGIDPYMSPGYRPEPDQWFPTGAYLYGNKKPIKSKIWQTEVLANDLLPIPPKKKEIVIVTKPTDTSLLTMPMGSDSLYFTTGIGTTTIDTAMFLSTTLTSTGFSYSWRTKSDTAKVVVYVDMKPMTSVVGKTDIKKMWGYKISKYIEVVPGCKTDVETKLFFDNKFLKPFKNVVGYYLYDWAGN